mgnify:FL=1
MSTRRRGNGQGTLFKRGGRGAWLIRWYDAQGQRRSKSTGTTDRRAAERILARHVADAALQREGVVDARAAAVAEAGKVTLGRHLEDYLAHLAATGTTERHVTDTRRRIERVADLAGVERLSDFTAEAVTRVLAKLRREGKRPATDDRPAEGLGLATVNDHLKSCKAFARWLHESRRTTEHLLLTVKPFNADEDPRHVRRDLTDEELIRLFRTTEGRDIEGGMAGMDRAMLYRLAASTGFRASELRSLTPESFDLDAETPAVTVEAAHSKRRRRDVQPIRRDVASILRPWLARSSPARPSSTPCHKAPPARCVGTSRPPASLTATPPIACSTFMPFAGRSSPALSGAGPPSRRSKASPATATPG